MVRKVSVCLGYHADKRDHADECEEDHSQCMIMRSAIAQNHRLFQFACYCGCPMKAAYR